MVPMWAVSAFILATAAKTAPKPAAEIAPYPPMHWHSWNTFCAEDMVNETNMMEMAEALLETGMVAAGYDTVNVVCNGWTGRDPATGELLENRTLWPVSPQFRVLACACALLTPQANPGSCYHRGKSS